MILYLIGQIILNLFFSSIYLNFEFMCKIIKILIYIIII